MAAAKHVEDQVDAVDLNLGCPQRVAHAEHFGSYLLDEKDRPLLCSIVKRFLDLFKVAICCCVCYCPFPCDKATGLNRVSLWFETREYQENIRQT